MGIFLCIDSALGEGSVAIYNGGKLLDFSAIPEKGMQAKYLVSTIHGCLEGQSLKPEQLDAIYCTAGPGGFTGIRIALSAAQALAMILDIPLIGVSTLACIATEADTKQSEITPIIPASQGKVYLQHFNSDTLEPLSEARMVALEHLKTDMGLVRLESSNIRGLELETAIVSGMDARSIGKLALSENFEKHHKLAATPLYIRPPDAALPVKKAGEI